MTVIPLEAGFDEAGNWHEPERDSEALNPAMGIINGLLISGCMWLAILWRWL